MILLSLVDQLWQFYLLWAVLGMCMAGSMYEPCFALITRARGADAKRGIVLVTLIAGFAGTSPASAGQSHMTKSPFIPAS